MYRIIAAALLVLIAGSAPPVAAAPGQADCQVSPSGAVVQQWSGTGDKNTEPFTVTGAPVKMRWTIGKSPYGSSYQLCWRMRSIDGKLGPGGCANDPTGETFIYAPAGTWYLDLKPSGSFSVSLEQL